MSKSMSVVDNEVARRQAKVLVGDPACGTGGFLLAAHDFISNNFQLDKPQKQFLKFNALKGGT
jgi:type I restriction enzyme M protein